MAFTGLVKPVVAKLDESSGTPKYTGKAACGKAIQLTVTVTYAEGSLYGDDGQAEYDREFSYADLVLNTTTLPVEVHNTMFGHTVTTDSEKSIKDSSADEAPYVGFGIYVPQKVDGRRSYMAIWFHKVKFTEAEETYNTKADSITYNAPSVNGRAVALESGEWRERQFFDTVTEAQAWLDEMASSGDAEE